MIDDLPLMCWVIERQTQNAKESDNQEAYLNKIKIVINSSCFDTLKKIKEPSAVKNSIYKAVQLALVRDLEQIKTVFKDCPLKKDIVEKINDKINHDIFNKSFLIKDLIPPGADRAIDYLIKNPILREVNLSEYPDIANAHLEKLFEKRPDITFLWIKSPLVISIPKTAVNLKTLYVSEAKSSFVLPQLPNLETFYATGVNQISEQPKLRELYLKQSGIGSLPNMPKVEKSSFKNVRKFQILRD